MLSFVRALGLASGVTAAAAGTAAVAARQDKVRLTPGWATAAILSANAVGMAAVLRKPAFASRHLVDRGMRRSAMVLSNFAHANVGLAALNMYAFWSVGGIFRDLHGDAALAATYLSAGVWSSVAARFMGRFGPMASMGASGAILGLVPSIALERPDARFGIVFVPGVSFSTTQLVAGLVAVDVVGLAVASRRGGRGLLSIDHAAHLGGMAAGAAAAGVLHRRQRWRRQ